MNGRAALGLSMCLLIAAAGCQTQVQSMSSLTSPGGKSPVIDPSQIKKAAPKFKELPPPILVSYGNFEAGEAFSPKTTDPEQRQHYCDSARANYEKALKLDPKYVPAYQGLAQLYSSMHELPLAVETYQKALKRASKNAALWYGLGLCYNSQKNLGSAVECLERAVRFEPNNRSYIDALGIVQAESGRYQDSLKSFVRSNGEAKGCYRLAQTLNHLQQPELSRRYLEAALQKDPNLATALTMRQESAAPANPPPPIQQTAYQAPAPAETNVVPVQPAPVAVAQPQTTQTVLPPPPPIGGE